MKYVLNRMQKQMDQIHSSLQPQEQRQFKSPLWVLPQVPTKSNQEIKIEIQHFYSQVSNSDHLQYIHQGLTIPLIS